ncbi:uncharacterized protein A1O9_10300 [Exophiala aquamarina CBS 119918]|uniref:Uncharacterized protein n=1 Tax=Exophiala aquamarina CBS 119918 TaxID=1182545 RepID=A0A072P3P9_9EURO|nr:uncharacterized protein A1O9_10300 [Exophiala aquamarina CBS 119918]KEF53898.1 hypothetical protein A1O9_10300 [Exophiala aquamarina CBS 119918]
MRLLSIKQKPAGSLYLLQSATLNVLIERNHLLPYSHRSLRSGNEKLPSLKRPRTSRPRSSLPDVNSITYWTRTLSWPEGYSNESGEMSHLLARKKSSASLHRKRSDSDSGAPSSTTPSDQKPGEEKSASYQDVRYKTVLATNDSFMGKYRHGATSDSKRLCQQLLNAQQSTPQDAMFSDDHFEDNL